MCVRTTPSSLQRSNRSTIWCHSLRNAFSWFPLLTVSMRRLSFHLFCSLIVWCIIRHEFPCRKVAHCTSSSRVNRFFLPVAIEGSRVRESHFAFVHQNFTYSWHDSAHVLLFMLILAVHDPCHPSHAVVYRKMEGYIFMRCHKTTASKRFILHV